MIDNKIIEFFVSVKADPAMQADLASIAETVKNASQRARDHLAAIKSMAPVDYSASESNPQVRDALAKEYQLKKINHERDLAYVEELGQKREELAKKFLEIGTAMASQDPGTEGYRKLAEEMKPVAEGLRVLSLLDSQFYKKRIAFAQEEVRVAKASSKDAEQESARIARQRDRDFAAITRSYLRNLQEQEGARQQEQRSFAAHSNRLGEVLSQTTESVMRVARGITMLGLVGEDDLQKVQDSLLKVQAAFDILTGATRGLLAIERAIDSINTITQIAARSQGLYNVAMETGLALQAAQGLAGAIPSTPRIGGLGYPGSMASAPRIGGLGHPGSMASAPRIGGLGHPGSMPSAPRPGGLGYPGSMPSAPRAGGLGDTGGAARSGLIDAAKAMIGDVIAGAIFGRVAQLFSGGTGGAAGSRIGMFVGGGINAMRGGLAAAGLKGAAGMGGAAVLGSGAVVAGSAAAAVGAGYMAGDILNAYRESGGIGQGARADSLTDKAARLIPSFSDMLIRVHDNISKQAGRNTITGVTQQAEIKRGAGLDKALMQQRAQYERILELRKQEEDVEENIKRVLADKWNMQGQLNDSIRSQLSDEKQLASIIDEINQLSTDALKDNENAQARKNDLIQQEMRLRQSIAGEHVQSLQDQLRMEQQSLATVEQRISAEKESVMTAKERFGMMSEDQQAEIIDLRERLRAGEDLDAEELGRLRGLSQGIDSEVQMQAFAKAEQGGFGALGIEEESRQRVQRDEDLATFLRESIEGNKGYIAQISLDAESVAKRLLLEVNLASEKKIKEIADKFNELSTAQAGVRAKIENITSNNIRLANESPP